MGDARNSLILLLLFVIAVFLTAFLTHHACASETPNCSPALPIPTNEYLGPTQEASPSATIMPVTIIPTETPSTGISPTITPTPVAGSSATVTPVNQPDTGNVIPQTPNTGKGR